MSKQFAIVKVEGEQMYIGYEITKLLTNGRCELDAGLKNNPILYYHRVYTKEEGMKTMQQIRTLQETYRQQVVDLYDELKQKVDQIVNPL